MDGYEYLLERNRLMFKLEDANQYPDERRKKARPLADPH
jgi:hypothetical protein